MKLLTRTNIYFIGITLVVFSLGGEVFYERVHGINKFDASERLEQEKNKIQSFVNINHELPGNSISLGDSVAFSIAVLAEADKTGHVKLYNSSEKEYEPYQTLEFTINSGTQLYTAIIYRPLLETDDLTTAIVEAMLIIGTCLFVVLLLSNFILSKLIWSPFYKTLEKIKTFDFTRESLVEFDKTSIVEFKTLNNVLKTITEKIASDYRTLKEFTENASHEMQTPLSIIQSKLELLIQSENLNAEQMHEVQAVYEASSRLAKLNQALLLLAKIENNQFSNSKKIQLDELIRNKIVFFEELIKHKNISIETNLEAFSIQIHPVLADIMVSNLIGNAIKHNQDGGGISIVLNQTQLSIRNSGKPLSIDPEQLFQRFQKADSSSGSLGLGLSIIKEICSVYHFKLSYKFDGKMHIISILF